MFVRSACWMLFLITGAAYAAQSVPTQHNDNQRSGANTAETNLTPANVNTATFGRLFIRNLDANLNGQVLYIPNVLVNGELHNVIYCTTSNNADNSSSSLYAFDADDPTLSAPLFRTQLTNSARATTGAPVIDPVTKTIYVLNKEVDSNGPSKLHAFDTTNGAEKPGSPIVISASVPGTGDGSVGGTLSFNTAQHNCRAALLFANGSVYCAFAHLTDSFPYHGWVFKYTYNGSGFTQDNVFCTTPHGGLGGIWQTGNGPMADAAGNIYVVVGNGVFNQSTNPPSYGMCILKLSPSLQVLDWFATSNELDFSNQDADTGNTGVAMIPGTDRMLTAGTKYGRAHLLDSNNLGHIGATPSSPDTCLQTITGMSSNIRQNPVAWNGGASGTFAYIWGMDRNPTAYRYSTQSVPAGQLTSDSTNPNYLYGGALCVTSNGTSNGILWAIENNVNAADNVFRAFDATDLSHELWNSNQNAARDAVDGHMAKFQFPCVVNGKAYVATQNATIYTYGLIGLPPTVSAVSPSSGLSVGGTTVTLSGTNFSVGTSVKIGNNRCTNVIVNNPTSLTCVTPASSPAGTQGAFNVTVTNTAGNATLTNGYTYSDGFRSADNPANTVAGTFFRYYNAAGPTLPAFSLVSPFRTGAKLNGTVLPENTVSYPIAQNDNFSLQFNGYLNVPSDGTWTLYTASDAASRLYIGNQLAVDNNFAQTMQTRKSVPMKLRQGLHKFTVQFAQSTGGFGCYLGWGSTDAVPPIALDPDPFTNGSHSGPPPASNLIPDSAYFYVPPTWTSGGTSAWSNSAAWNTDAGLGAYTPCASDTSFDTHESLVLRFPSVGGSAYTATNDLPNPPSIYVLELNSAIAGNTIQGNPLQFAGTAAYPYSGLTGPTIRQLGSGAAILSAPVTARETLTLNGNGTGVVTLSGALSNAVNGGSPTNLVKSGSSEYFFSGDGTGFAGGTITLNGGTLYVTGALPNAGTTTVNAGARLRGDGNGTSTGTIGAVTAAGGTIWPGTTATELDTKGALAAASANFSSGGILSIRLSTTAVNSVPAADKLVLNAPTTPFTANGTSTLNLAISAQSGVYNDRTVEIVKANSGNLITDAFANFVLTDPTGPTTGIALLYVDDTYTGSGSTGIVAIQAPGGAATPLTFAANRIVVRLNGNVTPVTLEYFTASAEGAGVLLEWRAVSEFQNVGFNVYRRAFGETWSRVNAGLIAGRLTNPEPKIYRLYDWAPVGVFQYKLESVNLHGGDEPFAQLVGPVIVESEPNPGVPVSSNGLAAAKQGCVPGVKEIDAVERAATAHLENARQSIQPQVREIPLDAPFRSGTEAHLPANNSRTVNGPAHNAIAVRAAPANSRDLFSALVKWFSSCKNSDASFVAAKAIYRAPGVLAISQKSLPAGFDIHRVDILREGSELSPLAVSGDKLIVYAPGYSDDYTDKDALFLRASDGNKKDSGPSRTTGLFKIAKGVSTDSPATASADYHDVYFDFSIRPYNYPPWFSSQYLTAGTTQTFGLATPGKTAGPVALELNLWSLSDSAHSLQVRVNGTAAGEAQWTGGNKMLQLSFQFDAAILKDGENAIDLVTPDSVPPETQLSFVHSMELGYTRSLDASKGLSIINPTNGAKLYEVRNVPGENAWVVDLTGSRPALVPYETQAQAGGGFKLRFQAPRAGRYCVVPAGQENIPDSVVKRQVKPLTADADYVAVGPSQFLAGVEPIVAQHEKEGIHGTIVDQEQLFDYYGYGRYGPEAIRSAVRAVRPRYLLLVGRTTYDYRNYSGENVDPLCPTFLVPTTFWAQATSDSRFGDLGRGFAEVAVGRLPVNDSTELGTAVARILAHKPISASGAKAQITADRFDPAAGNFIAEADALVQAHPEFIWQPNYLGVTSQTSPEVTDALRVAANGGADLLIYMGHGNSVRLGADVPRILDTSTVQAWTGNTIFLQATCAGSWMVKDEPGYRSIAMQALVQNQGGLSLSVGTSTYMDSDCAAAFMNRLLQDMHTKDARWGDVLQATQKWAYAKGKVDSPFFSDLSLTEQLFGDPAMWVHLKPRSNSGEDNDKRKEKF